MHDVIPDLLEIQSLGRGVDDVTMGAHYRFFYSKWSELMHSSGFFDHIWVDDSVSGALRRATASKILPTWIPHVARLRRRH